MKKVLKIVAFFLLIALAAVSLGFAIHHLMITVECLTSLSQSDTSPAMHTALSENALSNLKQFLSFAFNTFSCVVFCILIRKNVSITDAINDLKSINKLAKKRAKSEKIAKMKAKIEKLESDE